MGTPRSKVDTWDATLLGQVGTNTTNISAKIDKDADSMRRTIDGLDWSGLAKISALGRSEREERQIGKVGDAVNAVGTHATNGSNAMQPMITTLKTSATALEGNNFAVADDWAVTDKNNYDAALQAAGDNEQAKSQLREMQRMRGEEAVNETIRLQRLATELETADTACGNAITAANNEIRSLTPATAGMSPAAADHDLAAVKNGTATPEDLARIHEATQIPQELKDKIARGEEVALPQGQIDYLQQMMRAQDGLSVEDIEKLSSAMPPGQQGDLINAMQLASSPQVHSASVDGTVVDKGGMNQLPTQVKTLLTENPVGERSQVPPGAYLSTGAHIPRGSDFTKLNDMLSKGDKSLAHGTDLDRGVLKQVSEIAGATKDAEANGPTTFDAPSQHLPHTKEDINRLLDGLAGNVSGDHEAVRDFVTGQDMGPTVTADGQYNAEDHVMNILEHPWGDDSLGVQKMFEWVGGSEAASADPYVQQRAGETGGVLAHILSDNSQTLAPPGPESLRQTNPGLTQSLAGAVSPYLPNFAGTSDPAVLVNPYAQQFEKVEDLSNLFKTLDTDPDAARIINYAGAQWSNQLAFEAGQDPTNSALGHNAGQLNQAMNKGLTDPLENLQQARQWERVYEYNTSGQDWDKVVSVVDKVPFIGDAASIGSAFLKPELLDLPDNPVDLANDTAWSKALKPFQQTADQDSIVRAFNFVDGYAQTHDDGVSDGFTYLSRDGVERSFFDENGRLDWNVVTEHDDQFRNRIESLPDRPFTPFADEYSIGREDPTIDVTTLPDNAPDRPR